MGQLVVNGALLSCPMGSTPAPLTVTPDKKVNGSKMPAATIMDNVFGKNFAPFGPCKTLTSAASGVPTPCAAVIAAPWMPGSTTVMIGKMPALTSDSKLICGIGGTIQVNVAGQMTVNVK